MSKPISLYRLVLFLSILKIVYGIPIFDSKSSDRFLGNYFPPKPMTPKHTTARPENDIVNATIVNGQLYVVLGNGAISSVDLVELAKAHWPSKPRGEVSRQRPKILDALQGNTTILGNLRDFLSYESSLTANATARF